MASCSPQPKCRVQLSRSIIPLVLRMKGKPQIRRLYGSVDSCFRGQYPASFDPPPRPSLPVFPTLFLSFTFADLSICQARSSLKTFALGIPSTCNLLAPNFYMIFSLTSLGLCLKVIFSDHSFHYMPLPPPLSSTPPSFIFLYGIELYLALDYIFTCVLSIRRGILFYSWLCHQHLGHSQAHRMCSVFDK